MANKPNGFDEVNPWNDFEELPPGGYVCQILNAKEEKSKAGNDMVVVMLDIVEGEHANHFRNLFKARKDKSTNPFDVKYPFDGMAYITFTYEGKTTRKFKAFCTSIEESGRQIVWGDTFAESLKGAMVGVLFGREESEGKGKNEGKTFWNCKPVDFRSVDTIHKGDFKVPKDKPLPDTATQDPLAPSQPEGFTQLTDDEIQF